MYNSNFQPTQTIQIHNATLNDLRIMIGNLLDEKLKEFAENNLANGGKKLYTADELAEWFNVSKLTLWRYEKEGLLHPIKMGKVKIYDLDEVRELFANKGD